MSLDAAHVHVAPSNSHLSKSAHTQRLVEERINEPPDEGRAVSCLHPGDMKNDACKAFGKTTNAWTMALAGH